MTSSVIGRRSSKGESGNYIIEPHPDTHSSAKAVKGFMAGVMRALGLTGSEMVALIVYITSLD